VGALIISSLLAAWGAHAETLVVVEARGIGSTAGQTMDSSKHLSLLGGEHIRLIGANGNQYCLDGPYEGPARPPRRAAEDRGLLSFLQGADVAEQADPLTDCVQ
jgi:hypothetical protein